MLVALICRRETRKARKFLYERRYNTIRLDEALRALENGADAVLPLTSIGKRALEDESLELSASISGRVRKISRRGNNHAIGSLQLPMSEYKLN